MATPVRELDDIQALVRTGFGSLDGASFLLLRVTDAAAARGWIAGHPPISAAGLSGGHATTAHQIAVSAPGLSALGIDLAGTAGFAPEFLQGMSVDPGRSIRLGDVGANAPEHWRWGKAGEEPHLLLMLYAGRDMLPAFEAEMEAGLAGLAVIARLNATGNPATEPFGFADGVSQPTLDWAGEREPGRRADQRFTNMLAAGEILLGYGNEYGLVSDRPMAGDFDLGRNGSYVAMRSLVQDVDGFWAWAREASGTGDGKALAEAIVGRRMDGCPVHGLPTADIPGVGDRARNGFTYDTDADGHICPLGGHVRRANPRTGDLPGGPHGSIGTLLGALGFVGTARDDAIASTRFHRILRRGRSYGMPGEEQGLHFLCLNANIARQFEFVQGAWLANPKFAGLDDEGDPVVGSRMPSPSGAPTDRFTRPDARGPCARFTGLPRFVTVVGGGYFFLPGLRALRFIAGSENGVQ